MNLEEYLKDNNLVLDFAKRTRTSDYPVFYQYYCLIKDEKGYALSYSSGYNAIYVIGNGQTKEEARDDLIEQINDRTIYLIYYENKYKTFKVPCLK